MQRGESTITSKSMDADQSRTSLLVVMQKQKHLFQREQGPLRFLTPISAGAAARQAYHDLRFYPIFRFRKTLTTTLDLSYL